jgi:hypothetical protein
MDSIGRTSHTNITYYRFDATYGFPLVAVGRFSGLPTVGLGQEVAFLSLERMKDQSRFGRVDEYLENQSATFWDYGISIDLGLRAEYSFALDRRSRLEISLRPVYSLRILDVVEFEPEDLAQPGYSRFMLHVGVGIIGEKVFCAPARSDDAEGGEL